MIKTADGKHQLQVYTPQQVYIRLVVNTTPDGATHQMLVNVKTLDTAMLTNDTVCTTLPHAVPFFILTKDKI